MNSNDPIPYFIEGDGRRTAFSAAAMNELVAAINAMRNLSVVGGEVIKSSSNTVIKMARLAPSSGEAGGTGIVRKMTVTGILEDKWTALFEGVEHLVWKPFNLLCSEDYGNADLWDETGAHSLIAVDYTYSTDFLRRTSSASGFLDETSYLVPPMIPLVSRTITTWLEYGVGYRITLSADTVLNAGQYVHLIDCGAMSTNHGGWHKVQTVTNETNFQILAPTTITLGGSARIEFGGTPILVGENAAGELFDLNVVGRDWSQVPVTPIP